MEDLPEKFNLDNFLQKYRYHLLVVLLGIVLIGGGFLFLKKNLNFSSTKVEILQNSSENNPALEITAEIAGAVIRPGVYKMSGSSRIDDLLIISGGFSGNADRLWTDKYLNRAAKLVDGQKVYIPLIGEHSSTLSAKNNGDDQTVSSAFLSDSTSLININTADIKSLDSLPGIGPVYAQKITEHRPYSKTEDLVTSGVITQTLYEKIKNEITVY